MRVNIITIEYVTVLSSGKTSASSAVIFKTQVFTSVACNKRRADQKPRDVKQVSTVDSREQIRGIILSVVCEVMVNEQSFLWLFFYAP